MIAKVVKVTRMNQPASDYAYWRSRPVKERIDALETLRQQYIEFSKYVHPGLQRVLGVVKKNQIKISTTPRETEPITGAHIL